MQQFDNNPLDNNAIDSIRHPVGPVGGLVGLLVGLGCLAGAYYTGQQTQDMLTHGLHVQGVVTDIKDSVSTQTTINQNGSQTTTQQTMHQPVVTFEDQHHNSVRFMESMGFAFSPYEKGDKVTVIYSENDPAGTATIDKGKLNWFLPGSLGIIGAMFTLSGFWTMIRLFVLP